MILKRVRAENILKYRHLELTDLPAQGQIAVAGTNESGKTAVGETICFGLFGRTFSLGPDQLDRVIRWGEYRGSVIVEFTGSDGGCYLVAREINNTGRHTARLYISGESEPLADGVEAVAEAVREVGGFGYRSFVDSFYLAQREMEVPHGKSDTVKALIGVDKLEAASGEIKTEMADAAQAIRAFEEQIKTCQDEITEVGLDRARLGRLESQRETRLEAATAAETESAELTAREQAIGKATSSFIDTARRFVESTPRANYQQWQDRNESVAGGLAAVAVVSKASGFASGVSSLATTSAAVKTFQNGLAEYEKVRNLAHLYRRRLASLLDEESEGGQESANEWHTSQNAGATFPHRRALVEQQIGHLKARRRPVLVLGVFFVELACVAWAGWAVLKAAPDSTVAGWLTGLVGLSESARLLLFLLSAIGSSALTGLSLWLYARTTNRLRQRRQQAERIETEARATRSEIEMIDAMQQAALPDALRTLRNVRNDLLSSAVVSFVEGDGAVLVRPDALQAKLAQIRDGSANAVRSLRQSQQSTADRAAEKKRLGEENREAVEKIEQDIAQERERWGQVESLERTTAGLQAKTDELRRRTVIRKLGCDLIAGACRRIYSRFHPELRRFIGKILPRLTDDRYEHLEVNDDLRVRVFCKEKNDFVDLAEISNGTHRQLMLCVRLALSQALIASSSKTSQFIFFDEPFVFFDEHRMARAVDVLRRISPQITQVWLAAQKFNDPGAFDLHVDCNINSDSLAVTGGAAAAMAG